MKKSILIFVMFVLLISSNNSEVLIEDERAIDRGCLKPLGDIYLEQDWLYFTNFYDKGLYRASKDGKIINAISDEEHIIRVLDNNIYFMSNGILHRKNIDTDQKESLGIQGEILYINNNIIVFLERNERYCFYDFQTKKIEELSDQISVKRDHLVPMMAFEDDWLYFANAKDENKLYKMNVCDKSFYKLSDDACEGLCVLDGVIYYTNASDSHTLYRIDAEGENKMKLNDDRYTFYFKIYNDMIYYVNYGTGRIYRIDLLGNHLEQITDDRAVYFCIDDDFIYYSKIVQNIENDLAILQDDFPQDQAVINEINSIYKIGIDGGLSEKIM